jgi:hypothetical protein
MGLFEDLIESLLGPRFSEGMEREAEVERQEFADMEKYGLWPFETAEQLEAKKERDSLRAPKKKKPITTGRREEYDPDILTTLADEARKRKPSILAGDSPQEVAFDTVPSEPVDIAC